MQKAVIDVEARFVDHVTNESKSAEKAVEGIGKAADKTKKQVDNLAKKKVSPIFDADNNKFLSKIRKMEDKMSKLGRTKTAAVLDVIDKGTVKIGKLLNKGQQFGRKVWRGILDFNDSKALTAIRGVTNAAEKFTRKAWTAVVKIKDLATAPFRKIRDSLFSIKNIVATVAATLAVKKVVFDSMALADQYTKAQIGFSTLLGASAGQAMMDQIDAFAAATPFKTSNVISNVQKMMAFGWDADRVIEDMKTIGDAAASTGRGDQGLESIVYALSEIRTKGKLSTQELNQLASAGIKAKAYLAEGLGFGSDDAGMKKLAEALEDGSIGAQQAIDLILKGMKEFNGMMDKTANETFGGLKDQITDTFEISVVRRWGQGLQDGAKRAFGSVVSLLNESEDALNSFGDLAYKIGSKISNWFADKFEGAISRILEITDTFEFKHASFGEKISMPWKGVIADPLKEWWEGGGRRKTAETAGKIGKWMGQFLTKGLLAIFGATEVLKDIDGTDMGESVAGSFVQGFLQNFDGKAIADAFVDALKNVWNALPWWGKLYLGGKALSGAGNIIGGIGNFVGGVGKASTFLSNGVTSLGYLALGGKQAATLAGFTGTQAALAGTGIVAGGAAAIYGGYKGSMAAGDAYKAFKAGDTRSGWANTARAGATMVGSIGGMAAGAKIGAGLGTAIGSVVPIAGNAVGAVLGTGIGALAGWLIGDAIGDAIEGEGEKRWKAKWESKEMRDSFADGEMSDDERARIAEKANWENAKKSFGDIKLSMQEISRLVDQIVWKDDLAAFETFSTATQTAEANLQSMKSQAMELDKWMWKAGLGVKFNADEAEAFTATMSNYIASAKSYLENKHYEFTSSASLLLDLESDVGKSILEGGNAYYAEQKTALDEAGNVLGDELVKALEDGIISADENDAIIAAQEKVAAITEKLANAEWNADAQLIKVKFGGDKLLDLESFYAFMSTMGTSLTERMSASDEAMKVQLTNLELRYEGKTKGDAYNKELQAIFDGYNAKVEKIRADVMGVELGMLGDAYNVDSSKLEEIVKSGVDPILWGDEDVKRVLGLPDEVQKETLNNLRDSMQDVLGHLEITEVDLSAVTEATERLNLEKQCVLDMIVTAGETVDADEVAAIFGVKEEYAKKVLLKLEGKTAAEKLDIMQDHFGIPKKLIANTIINFNAIEGTVEKIDITDERFGLTSNLPVSTKVDVEAEKGTIGVISLAEERFGVLSSYDIDTTVNITANKGTVKTDGEGFRGGIFGGSFSNGGMVSGGSKLIEVAEEGSPEMIIPLSSQRRGRALKLWAQAGNIMGVPGFARGGLTNGNNDEGIRFGGYGSNEGSGGQTVQIDVGGITFEIHVNGDDPKTIAEAIKAQANEIAESVAGVLADSFGTLFENTPVRGGVA